MGASSSLGVIRNESLNPVETSHAGLRRQLDCLRVQLWYAWMAHRSGETGRKFEKRLLPKNFAGTVTATLSHRKRMERFAKGEHVPRRDLVQRADVAFPGSRRLLEHPCWQVLDPSLALRQFQSAWIEGLGTDVARLLFEQSKKTGGVSVVPTRRRATPGLLYKLEHLASFDALAGTALLLREAQADGRVAFSFECARSFWILLLLLGSTSPFTGALKALAQLSGDALLDRVEHRGQRVAVAIAPVEIFEHALCAHCFENIDDERAPPSRAQFVEEQLNVLRGTARLDVKYALQLPTIAGEVLKASPDRYAAFRTEQWVRHKALDYTYETRYRTRSFSDDLGSFYRDPERRWPL